MKTLMSDRETIVKQLLMDEKKIELLAACPCMPSYPEPYEKPAFCMSSSQRAMIRSV